MHFLRRKTQSANLRLVFGDPVQASRLAAGDTAAMAVRLIKIISNIYIVCGPLSVTVARFIAPKVARKKHFLLPFRDGSAQALLSSASCNAASARSLPEMQRTTHSI